MLRRTLRTMAALGCCGCDLGAQEPVTELGPAPDCLLAVELDLGPLAAEHDGTGLAALLRHPDVAHLAAVAGGALRERADAATAARAQLGAPPDLLGLAFAHDWTGLQRVAVVADPLGLRPDGPGTQLVFTFARADAAERLHTALARHLVATCGEELDAAPLADVARQRRRGPTGSIAWTALRDRQAIYGVGDGVRLALRPQPATTPRLSLTAHFESTGILGLGLPEEIVTQRLAQERATSRAWGFADLPTFDARITWTDAAVHGRVALHGPRTNAGAQPWPDDHAVLLPVVADTWFTAHGRFDPALVVAAVPDLLRGQGLALAANEGTTRLLDALRRALTGAWAVQVRAPARMGYPQVLLSMPLADTEAATGLLALARRWLTDDRSFERRIGDHTAHSAVVPGAPPFLQPTWTIVDDCLWLCDCPETLRRALAAERRPTPRPRVTDSQLQPPPGAALLAVAEADVGAVWTFAGDRWTAAMRLSLHPNVIDADGNPLPPPLPSPLEVDDLPEAETLAPDFGRATMSAWSDADGVTVVQRAPILGPVAAFAVGFGLQMLPALPMAEWQQRALADIPHDLAGARAQVLAAALAAGAATDALCEATSQPGTLRRLPPGRTADSVSEYRDGMPFVASLFATPIFAVEPPQPGQSSCWAVTRDGRVVFVTVEDATALLAPGTDR